MLLENEAHYYISTGVTPDHHIIQWGQTRIEYVLDADCDACK